MKKFFTLFVLALLFQQAEAQVLFSQDFESGSLAPMTAVDVDGRPLAPNIATFAGPTWKVVGTSPDRKVVSTSWFAPPGIADDWLISPPITITATNTFLLWEAFNADPAYRDGYQVRVSTTDNLIASFTNILLTVPAEETVTKKRALRLDAFIGQTIYFAYRNNSDDKFLLYLDNISVEVLPNLEATIKGVSFEKYNPIGTLVPIKIAIENNGADPITSMIYTWSDGTDTYVDTVTGLNIGTREIVDHIIYFDLATVGEYPISFQLLTANGAADGNPYDNGGGRLLYGLNEQLPKKVVVEEGTGTWCGWCPRGFVAMEHIAATYPDVVIPIAVHNGDPMTVPAYDSVFSQTIGGYPSGHADRKEIDIDPDHPTTHYGFDDAVLNLDGRMVPVQVDVQTSFDPLTRMVTILGTSHLSVATQENQLRYSVILTEDNVTGTSANGFDQVNYYAGGANGVMGGFQSLPDPVPASQMIYNFTARALIGGFEGMENSIPDALAADEEFAVNVTYQVPAGFDENEMKAIVLVLDEETGEILNANFADVVNAVSVPLVPVGKSVLYPNPATDVMNLSVNYQTSDPVSLRIYDTYGRLIRTLSNLDLSSGSIIEKIDVSDIHCGNYILELRHKNAVTALPFTRI